MLMTTPLRNPCEGWEPTPMISTPRSVISPTTTQTLDVPISKPTTMLFFFPITPSNCSKLALPPTQPGDDLVAKTHIQGRQPLLVALPQQHQAIHAAQFVFPIAPPHAQGQGKISGVNHQPIGRLEMDFRKRVRTLGHQLGQTNRVLNTPTHR